MCEVKEVMSDEQLETKKMMNDFYRHNYRIASRVIIAGSRDFDDCGMMKKKLDELFFVSDAFDAVSNKDYFGYGRRRRHARLTLCR